MGFPVGYTEVFFPNLFLHTLGFLRNLVFILFHILGLSDFLETDVVWPEPNPNNNLRIPDTKKPSLSSLLIRDLLPVAKFSDLDQNKNGAGMTGGCAVCLYEFSGEDEIRCMKNCKHIFHRGCVDRWIDHDQKTCPLCRTPFVPDDMIDDYNQRLCGGASSSASSSEFSYAEFTSFFDLELLSEV